MDKTEFIRWFWETKGRGSELMLSEVYQAIYDIGYIDGYWRALGTEEPVPDAD